MSRCKTPFMSPTHLIQFQIPTHHFLNIPFLVAPAFAHASTSSTTLASILDHCFVIVDGLATRQGKRTPNTPETPAASTVGRPFLPFSPFFALPKAASIPLAVTTFP